MQDDSPATTPDPGPFLKPKTYGALIWLLLLGGLAGAAWSMVTGDVLHPMFYSSFTAGLALLQVDKHT